MAPTPVFLGVALALANPAAARLVDALAAPDPAAREAAQLGLAKLGPAAAPILTKALADPRPEVRGRAEVLLAGARLRAASLPYLAPGRVAFACVDRPLNEALADLAARTGLKLRLADGFPDPQKPVTLSVGPLPPWEAVEAFRAAAGLAEQFDSQLPALMLAPGQRIQFAQLWNGARPAPNLPASPPAAAPPADPSAVAFGPGPGKPLPADRAGAVRVRALPPGDSAHATDRDAGVVSLALDLAAPDSLGLGPDARVTLTRAIDNRGRPVTQAFPPAPADETDDDGVQRVFFFNGGVGRMQLDLGGAKPANPRVRTLDLLAGGATRLVRLEGVVVATVRVADRRTLTIPDLLADANNTLPDGSVVRLNFEQSPTAVSLTLFWSNVKLLQSANGMFLPMDASEALKSRFRFWAANGQELLSYKFTRTEWVQSNGVCSGTIAIEFPPAKPPHSLTVTGTREVVVELPFALTDVPLP